ncbi:hypothetical protein GWK47_002749 [Chionoecetes opilio]|uniref:Uncharacterized protein n=1 Tax=Chionoecetes opilio TaxID=41210 RepID=A0A8J5CCB2_CHIOP|nr:hypothetical protein GWK47_002749 [Chionoecetes opilio]
MTCKKGGFVCIRHDEVRDLTASMLKEVGHDVSTEPTLLPLDGELLRYGDSQKPPLRLAWTLCSGILDQRAADLFGHPGLRPDGRPIVSSPSRLSTTGTSGEKTRAYGEGSCKSTMVPSRPGFLHHIFGGMAPKARSFYSRLAD